MKKLSGSFVTVGCTILVALLIIQNPPAFAGWTGIIDGAGKGWASVNVRASTSDTSKVLTTVNNLLYPSAANPPTTGYKTNASLPGGAAATTFSRLRGLSGGFWSGSTSGTNSGDGTDNRELQNRVNITPSDCASLSFDSIINQSQAQFNANGNSGTITVNAKATGGTALWLRGFEYTGSMADVPLDDPATVENEGIEYLKINGVVRFETLILGPFEFGGPGGANCPLIVPFSLTSSNLEHLIFATDAAALSLPLVVVCPPSIEVKCDEPFSYPPVQYAGCGNITISYSPAVPAGGSFAAGAFPVGTNTVTVTATDSNGHSTNCTFTVTVTDTTGPVVPALPVLTGEASVTVPQPPATTDNCGGTVTASTKDPLIYTNQGVFTVHWNFDDGNGNTNTANQTVIVDDVTAPISPLLATVTAQCSATVPVPTASDAVAGTVAGTSSDPLTYSSQGTFTVHWTFNDGNGNSSTANQTVIVKDTMAPAPDVATLPVVNGTCSTPAFVTAPTATDNCAGKVTATTTRVFPITALGTTVVTWTFSDGNGNQSTQTQTVNLTGLIFQGFYSPVGTANNTISTPVTRTAGASFPLKWDMFCGTTRVTTGTPPTVDIQKVSGPGSPGPVTTLNAEYQNDWHINWPTPSASKNDTYKATVTLPDGSTAVLFVKFK